MLDLFSFKYSTGEPAYLSQLSNDETGFSHYMCSYARLRNLEGRETISYGWDHSTSTITFIYFKTDVENMQYCTVQCPCLLKVRNRKGNVIGYSFTNDQVNGLVLYQFYPVCLYWQSHRGFFCEKYLVVWCVIRHSEAQHRCILILVSLSFIVSSTNKQYMDLINNTLQMETQCNIGHTIYAIKTLPCRGPAANGL